MVQNIKFPISIILKTNHPILIEQAEKTLYENGQPTDKKYISAVVTSIESGFEKIAVKLDGPGINISNEEIAAANLAHNFVYVGFTGDEAKLYTDRAGETRISAKASTIFRLDGGDTDEISL